ncbi:MAG: glycosyltransferase [Bacteroidaceae bacterium]|nr:glycosyltransferase [Bacteroidaceae bacterium]
MDKIDFLVSVRCLTYNHAAYIRDTMDGFCMQQTYFPFVCVILDDASTDGEQEVIKNYLALHFEESGEGQIEETNDYVLSFSRHKHNKNCFFAVYFLKTNHFGKKAKAPYLERWEKWAKYVAYCEGDDYWLDENKIQLQVDYMENNSNCSMTCSRTKYYSQKLNRYNKEQYCRKGNGFLNIEDVIYRQGLYISTCSVMFRYSIMEHYPSYCRRCLIGDYPLQLYAALVGSIYYFDNVMSVYRVDNSESWMGRQASVRGTIDEKRLAIMDSTLDMLSGFLEDYPKYSSFFKNKIAEYINRGLPYRRRSSRTDIAEYINHFQNYVNQYKLFWRIDLAIRKIRIPGVRTIYTKLFMGQFYEKTISC